MRFLHTADWHLGKKLHGFDLQAEQQAALDGIKEIVQSTIEAVQGMGHIQIDLQRFVNQQKVTLGAYRDLLKDIYRWQDWRHCNSR